MTTAAADWSPFEEPCEVYCDHCGELRPCLHLVSAVDSEFRPDEDNPKSWWCRPCYTAAGMDI